MFTIFQNRPNIPEDFEIVYSHRKSLAIQIKSPGIVIIRAPSRCKNIFIENFVNSKKDWIEKNLQKIIEKSQNNPEKKILSEQELQKIKSELLEIIKDFLNNFYKKFPDLPTFTSLKITKSEGRWWSCSSKNWLCFSYRLHDYKDKNPYFIEAVVAHELAHLIHKNHSKNFYNFLYTLSPNYEKIIKNKNL